MRGFTGVLCLATFASLGAPARVLPADSTEIAPGTWVRVTTDGEGGKTLQGSVRLLDGSTLVLERPDDPHPISISRSDIAVLDVRRQESRKTLGIVIGVAAGGLLGYAVGRSGEPECASRRPTGGNGLENLCFAGVSSAGGGLLGALAGGLLGGFLAPGAKWEKDQPLDRVRVSVSPTLGRGIGASLTLAF
jgi:hypothetical protein